MNDVDRVKKALETIKNNGDMFDLVEKARNNKPYDNAIVRFNILLFSRIWYLGLLAKDKIASKFVNFNKIEEATKVLRDASGVNIDIAIPKYIKKLRNLAYTPKKTPVVLYENSNAYMDEYIADLKKILSFISLYNIPEAYLLLSDIENLFPGVNLSKYWYVTKETFFHNITLEEDDDNTNKYLHANKEELEALIKLFESYKVDKKFIMSLGRRISDRVIMNALDDFQKTGDIDALKNTLSMRLALTINSDSSYKTKEMGKAFDMVDIHDEYIKVITTYKDYPKNETTIMLLCEYLGFPSYDALLKSADSSFDDEEKNLMAIIYLYLCKQRKNVNVPKSSSLSYYDRVYESFKKGEKSIEGLHSKPEKIAINFVSLCIALYFTAATVAAGFAAGALVELADRLIRKNSDMDILKAATMAVVTPYKYSYEFEKSLISGILSDMEEAKTELSDSISGFIGDTFGIHGDDKIAAVIKPLYGTQSSDLPRYFACEYGASSAYSKGNIEYDLVNPLVKYDELSYSNPEFEVEVFFTKKELREMIKDNVLEVPYAMYPVDSDYFITSIVIKDAKDDSKKYIITPTKAHYYNGQITEEEKALLYSMKKPSITYYYALEPGYANSFATSMEKTGTYLNSSEEEMLSAIKKGLNLSDDADIYDILYSIQNKKYSTSPFKDAHISSEIKKYDELAFIEKVASLDTLVCNLAATLAVQSDENLYYVVGFYSSENMITYGMAHAWAMDEYGDLIDVTPDEEAHHEEESGIIASILDYAASAGLPFFAACFLTSFLLGNYLKKKITFKIKVLKVQNFLNSDDKNRIYALINDTLYGGINMPPNFDDKALFACLCKDFEGWSKEDLKYLLESLKTSSSDASAKAYKVVKILPFIKQNEEYLTRTLNKPKKK